MLGVSRVLMALKLLIEGCYFNVLLRLLNRNLSKRMTLAISF